MADQDQELNDAALMDQALTDEPVKAEPEKVEAEEPKTEQPRDEQGKFASKEAPKTEAAAEPAKAEEAKAEDEGGNVPSWRLREVAEERRAAQAERDALRQQLQQLQARIPQPQAPKVEEIDPLLDPQGFAKELRDGFNRQLSELQLNNNLALAHVRHGEKFEKAYGALIATANAGNRQIVGQLTSQANPGEAIVKWYSDQETLKEVGGDPAAYKNKLLEDALKNPEFLAKAIEAAKVSAGQQGGKAPLTKLPPSLSSMAGGGAHTAADDDMSDAGLFNNALR